MELAAEVALDGGFCFSVLYRFSESKIICALFVLCVRVIIFRLSGSSLLFNFGTCGTKTGMKSVLVLLIGILVGLLHYISRVKYVSLSEGVIFITGASTGIGRHAAEYLASRHSKFVVLAGVRRHEDAAEITSLNISNLKPILIDVASHESCVRAIQVLQSILETSNPSTSVALVNNAASGGNLLPLEYENIDNAKQLFNVNLFGVIDLVQMTLPLLRQSKGRILMISSLAGTISQRYNAIYSASKFALEAISDALRREVRRHGISISVIRPAFVKSAIFTKVKSSSIDLLQGERGLQANEIYSFSAPKVLQTATGIESRASDPIVVSEAIEHAILSPTPLTRYVVATVYGIPARIVDWFDWLTTDRFLDLLLSYQ